MTVPNSRAVLQLYRRLLRYGNQLEYTNKSFYLKRIQTEFRQNKELSSEKDIEFELKRGEALLTNARIV